MVSFGYHCQGIVTLLFTAQKQDFVEMGLHHLVTLILSVSARQMNFVEMSVHFGWIHDIADAPLSLTKFFAETRFKNTTGSLFILTTMIWAYTRCYALPILCL